MKRTIFMLLIISCIGQEAYAQRFDETEVSYEALTIDDCFENAARKIVDSYSYTDRETHDVVDIDIIHKQTSDNTADISVQWIALTANGNRIFWVRGEVRYSSSACCGAYFRLVDHSETVNTSLVLQNLNCTDNFIQRSLGTGKPFRPRARRKH